MARQLHGSGSRHASATLAAWTGASTKELMVRLGHSTPHAALRYQHGARHRDRQLADRLGRLFVGRTTLYELIAAGGTRRRRAAGRGAAAWGTA